MSDSHHVGSIWKVGSKTRLSRLTSVSHQSDIIPSGTRVLHMHEPAARSGDPKPLTWQGLSAACVCTAPEITSLTECGTF